MDQLVSHFFQLEKLVPSLHSCHVGAAHGNEWQAERSALQRVHGRIEVFIRTHADLVDFIVSILLTLAVWYFVSRRRLHVIFELGKRT